MSQGRQCWAAAGAAGGGLVTKTLNIETCGERPAAGLPSDNPSACGESQLQCQVSKYNPVIM